MGKERGGRGDKRGAPAGGGLGGDGEAVGPWGRGSCGFLGVGGGSRGTHALAFLFRVEEVPGGRRVSLPKGVDGVHTPFSWGAKLTFSEAGGPISVGFSESGSGVSLFSVCLRSW